MTPDPIAARARELNVNPSAIPPHALLKWLESRTFSSKDQPYVDGIRDFIRLRTKDHPTGKDDLIKDLREEAATLRRIMPVEQTPYGEGVTATYPLCADLMEIAANKLDGKHDQ